MKKYQYAQIRVSYPDPCRVEDLIDVQFEIYPDDSSDEISERVYQGIKDTIASFDLSQGQTIQIHLSEVEV